jgi:hypothetical protein
LKKKPENVAKANYKHDFRPTQDYKDALRNVKSQVKDILSVSERIPDCFNRIDVMPLFDWNDIDFNDAYYMRLCDEQSNKVTLVTDDKDILENPNIKVELLTA